MKDLLPAHSGLALPPEERATSWRLLPAASQEPPGSERWRLGRAMLLAAALHGLVAASAEVLLGGGRPPAAAETFFQVEIVRPAPLPPAPPEPAAPAPARVAPPAVPPAPALTAPPPRPARPSKAAAAPAAPPPPAIPETAPAPVAAGLTGTEALPAALPALPAPEPAAASGPPAAEPAAAAGHAPLILAQPRYETNSPPVYPALARKRGLSGTVVLSVLVAPDGRVAELAVLTSSGHPSLDQAALAAVADWTFVPGRRGETPVACPVQVPVRFQIR
ncbi:MAG: energy transducer TonB [Thermodesulfobacteriota bacterium]